MSPLPPQYANEVLLNPKFFRPGTKAPIYRVNYVVADGGLGDYIGYMTAIKWIAENCPNVEGHVYCGNFFIPIAQEILSPFPRWTVESRETLTEEIVKASATFGPTAEPISRIGCHAVDLGFIYYNHQCPAPVKYYPQLTDLNHVPSPMLLPKDYAVLTPVFTHSNRKMGAASFNEVCRHLKEKGITPVFIGELKFAERQVALDPEFDLTRGLNLLGKTTLLQAAKVMAGAKAVIGVDNGLLHLAAMTETPIVAGFTVAAPVHALPRRESKKIKILIPPVASLTCSFCQSQMRNMGNHNFNKCIYGDDACVKLLDDPAIWVQATSELIG